MRLLRIGTGAAALILALAVAAGAEPIKVRDVRIAPHADGTRVVIDLDGPVSFRHLALDAPPRLAIDLPEVTWQVEPRTASDGLVRGFRFGRFRPNVSRIVFDIAEPFEIRKVFELPPNQIHGHRIVTDLVAADGREHAASTVDGVDGTDRDGGAGPWSGSAQPATLRIDRLPAPKPGPGGGKPTIVIDPGHGGIDPGAIGTMGTYEKTVVLAMGLELRRQLEASGRYRVIMTRDTDQIVRLRDRLHIARESDGDFFISLHSDSLPNAPEVRGASVYTLSETASNEEAGRLAHKENLADVLAGVDLTDQEQVVREILIDLAQRDANNKSIRIAEFLVEELGRVSKMARHHRSSAGFVVLKSPDMPSVLVELGYLSNANDEQALRDPNHLAELGAAMVEAIDRYIAETS